MKNLLILAGIAGIAAAIAIYFTSESFDTYDTDDTESGYVTDADIFEYDMKENSGDPVPVG